MKLLPLFISIYLIGYLVFTTAAFFGTYHEWDIAWFIWNNISNAGALVWVVVYFMSPMYMRKLILWVMVFGISISVWQITAVIMGISWNTKIGVSAELLVLLSVFTKFLWQWVKTNKRPLLTTKN